MSTAREILALEERRYAAMTTNDVHALEALFHDDLLYVHSTGVADTRASYLEALRTGKTRYKSAQRSDEHVRFAGDAALVTGRAKFEVEVDGKHKSLNLAFLDVWTRTPAGWKFIAWQSCSLPA